MADAEWEKVDPPLGERREEHIRRDGDWMLCVWLPANPCRLERRDLWRWASYDDSGFVSCSATTEDTATADEAMALADAWLYARGER